MDDASKINVQGRRPRRSEIKKIENATERQITCSKRRSGLFKKAAEFSDLYGVQSAAIAFSPGGKPYIFNATSLELLTHRLVLGEAAPPLPLSGSGPFTSSIDRLGFSELARLHAAAVAMKSAMAIPSSGEISDPEIDLTLRLG